MVANKILRHIHKKDFPFFWAVSCSFAIKVYKKCQQEQKLFLSKYSMWVSKNPECHTDFESVEKVLKKCTNKKLLAKMWWTYALFTLLLMFVKLVLLITFFGAFFNTFFNGFEISVKFCVFYYLFYYFQKKIFFVISHFLKLWSQTR